MKIIQISIILFIINVSSIYSQDTGYIIKGKTYKQVITIDYMSRSNSKFCHYKVAEDSLERKYTPNEIDEYGLPNGKEFVAKTINIEGGDKRVFLERVKSGKLSFYYYGGKSRFKYYMEKDSVLTQLREISPFGTYKQVLENLTSDCYSTKESIRKVSFSKKSLATITLLYNKCDTKSKPFPTLRYGVILGVNITSVSLNTQLGINNSRNTKIDFDTDINFNYGIFIEYPLSIQSSVYTEILLNKNTYSDYMESNNRNTDILNITNTIHNYKSLEIPLTYKYTFVDSKLMPFFNVGLNYIQVIDIDSYSLVSSIKNSIVTNEDIDNKNNFSTNFIGITLGGGFNIKIYNDSYLSLKFQANYNSGIKSINDSEKSSTVKSANFRIAYNF